MRVFIWLLQSFFSLAGVVATYLPLWASFRRWADMWGIAWQIWAMIGVTVLLSSLATIIYRLYQENRSYRSEEGKLQREKLRREVEQLRSDQSVKDTGHLW